MKKLVSINTVLFIAIVGALFALLCMFFNADGLNDYDPEGGESYITLYGEAHGIESFYDAELEGWGQFYSEGCRDLFIELSYYEGELLNDYMKAEDAEILDVIYDSLEGTPSHTQYFLDFYTAIKRDYPETVFHGTDIGHQYWNLGPYYLEYLEKAGLKDSDKYQRTLEVMEQGRAWYEDLGSDGEFRENLMVENFIWDYDRLVSEKGGEKVKIMGIYGGYHTNMKDNVMSTRLKNHYSDIISVRYVANKFLKADSYAVGFSYFGLIFVALLLIPNIIFGFTITDELRDALENKNMFLTITERVGEALICIVLLLFPANNPRAVIKPQICMFFSRRFEWFVLVVLFMAIYEIFWIRFFRSKKTVKDLYHSTCGVPFAGAILPCFAVFCLGVYAGNLVTIAAAVIFTIGHLGIHISCYKRYFSKN